MFIWPLFGLAPFLFCPDDALQPSVPLALALQTGCHHDSGGDLLNRIGGGIQVRNPLTPIHQLDFLDLVHALLDG